MPYSRIACWLSCVLFLLLLLACDKKQEQIDLPWTEVPSPTSYNLNDVHFIDAQIGFAVGGGTWYIGIQLTTKDGGQSWQVDSIADKELLSLHFTADNKGFSVGIDKHFLHTKGSTLDWNVRRIPGGNINRDVGFFDQSGGIVVGGVAYQAGYILRLDSNLQVIQVDSFDHEISGVYFSEAQTVHAVGYGILLRSTDAGRNWQRLQVYGGFFRDVHFPSPLIGYIVGSSGNILKTKDGGQSWQLLRDGDQFTVADLPFRSVFFVSDTKGYIVGGGGLFWRTIDGGDSWQCIKGLPSIKLLGVHVHDGIGFIVGEDGRIFRFED